MTDLKIVRTWNLGHDVILHPKKYNGFLGISLTSPYYKEKSVLDYIEFGIKNFERFALFPVDIPYRYNYIVFEGLSEKNAYIKAKKLGDDLEKYLYKILCNIGMEREIKILRWEDLVKNEEALRILNYFEKLIYELKELNEDIKNHILEQSPHIEKRLLNNKKLDNFNIETQRKTLYRFLMDEIAMFIFIQEFLGYTIRLSGYPESNITMDIYDNKYFNFKKFGLGGKIGQIQLKRDGR